MIRPPRVLEGEPVDCRVAQLNGLHRYPFSSRAAVCGLLTLVLSAVGCGTREPIRHYKVPKPEVLYAINHIDPAEKVASPSRAGEATDRLLGAIVPRERRTWYFKMAGPKELVASQEDAFRKLIESLTFAGPDAPPEWKLPPSWKAEEGTDQRLATLSVTVGGQRLEVSIIQLATNSSPNSVLDNVNRWRRQMQLEPITAEQLPQESTTLPLADGMAVYVNLVGSFSAGGMSSRGSLTKTPPVETKTAPDSGIQFAKPESWTNEPPVSFSVLAFGVRNGSAAAQITVSPLKGDAGGLLANVNRWFNQVGLPPLQEQELAAKTEQITVDGTSGIYAEVVGDEGSAGEVIVGWIGFREGQTWFVKMKGERQLVLAQREAFRTFLQSLRFSQ